MTQQLFLIPATDRKAVFRFFSQTMLEGIPRNFYENYTNNDYGEQAHIWGLTSTTEGTWNTFQTGDWVLFYVSKNQYRYAGRVIGKQHNPNLGDAIRNEILEAENPHRDWDYLLFFDNPIEIQISGESVGEIFDYNMDYPVRVIRVTEERLRPVKEKHGSIRNFIEGISK